MGTYQALRFDVLDDMKLGKVVKNAGYAQRNVFGADLISIRWAKGACGRGGQSHQEFLCHHVIPVATGAGLLFRPGFPEPHAFRWESGWRTGGPGWAIRGCAFFSMFSIYVGMSTKSDIPPYYFVLHPVSTALFVYTMLRSTFLTLGRGGVVWRGTFYPLEELRRGMV